MDKTPFLKNILLLRGFAILNIMIVHIWSVSLLNVEENSIYPKIINEIREVFFHDSTIYFIFISGFLVKYLSSRYNTSQYYTAKLKNVIFPYLFLSTAYFFLKFLTSEIDSPVNEFFGYIFSGKAQVSFWYIPFIFFIFLISPLLWKVSDKQLQTILPILIMLPFLGTRSGTTLSLGQYAYFFPIYMLGVVCAVNYEGLRVRLEKCYYLLIALMVISTCLLFLVSADELNYSFVNLYESLHYVQKMSVLFFLIVFFEKIEHRDMKVLNVLGEYSFALFFVHTFVDRILNQFILQRFHEVLDRSEFLIIPISIIYTLVIICVSLLLCILINKSLGKKSRYFIGV